MNEYLGMLLDADPPQWGTETLHLALLAFAGILSTASCVIGWFLRRDLKRNDDDKEKMVANIKEVGIAVDCLKDKHGSEISDTRIAIAPLFDRAGLQQPNYPSR